MSTIAHHFTFGSGHMSSYPLPVGGLIADYWVTVELEPDSEFTHRELFIEHFTRHFCPDPLQFAMEYRESELNKSYFHGGRLCVINAAGIKK